MNKKILLALAAASLALTVSGCGDSLPSSKQKTDTPPTYTEKYGDRTAYVYECQGVDVSKAHSYSHILKKGDNLYFISANVEKNDNTYPLYQVKIEKETTKDLKKLCDNTIRTAPIFTDGKNVYFSQNTKDAQGKKQDGIAYLDGTTVKPGADPKASNSKSRCFAKDGYIYEVDLEREKGKAWSSVVNLMKVENGKFTKEGNSVVGIGEADKYNKAAYIRADAQNVYIYGILLKDGKEVKEEGRTIAGLSVFDTKGKYVRSYTPGYRSGSTFAVTDHFVVFASFYSTRENNKNYYEWTVYNKADGKEVGRFKLPFFTEAMTAEGDSIYAAGSNKKLFRMDL